MELIHISRALAARCERLRFVPPVYCRYNPLVYAREPHELYVARYGVEPREVLLLGMNPGPFGMVQTGVPFGDVAMVRDWLGIVGKVERQKNEHPKRPVRGFECARSEVSGSRLWGWARARYGTPEKFFARFFVANYCPLAFVDDGGRNLTPDKLPAAEQQELFAACDDALRRLVAELRPRYVVGVGAFAEGRARLALSGQRCILGTILHPSPANPKANRAWSKIIEEQLKQLGIEL